MDRLSEFCVVYSARRAAVPAIVLVGRWLARLVARRLGRSLNQAHIEPTARAAGPGRCRGLSGWTLAHPASANSVLSVCAQCIMGKIAAGAGLFF